jgi:hypothetical protein
MINRPIEDNMINKGDWEYGLRKSMRPHSQFHPSAYRLALLGIPRLYPLGSLLIAVQS